MTNKSNKSINDNYNNYLNQDVKVLADKHIKFYGFYEETSFKLIEFCEYENAYDIRLVDKEDTIVINEDEYNKLSEKINRFVMK